MSLKKELAARLLNDMIIKARGQDPVRRKNQLESTQNFQ